jgi:deoxycytidine triphosphate deaminase
MGVLTKSELLELANNKGLLGGDFDLNNFEPSSYDLRIGSVFKNGKIYSEHFNTVDFNNNIEIKPSEIVTLLTLEEICIPSNCIGTVFALNSHSSTGLLILNPGHIDPGFKGPISICAINLSNQIIRLHIKQKIFTLIIETTNKEIPKGEIYNGNKVISRKEREELFNRNNASRLSSSFFDLISEYRDTPYFREQVIGIFKEKAWEYMKTIIKFISIVGSVILFLIAIKSYFKDDVSQKEIDSQIEQIKKRGDSLLKLNDTKIEVISQENKVLLDSLNSFRLLLKKNTANGKIETKH